MDNLLEELLLAGNDARGNIQSLLYRAYHRIKELEEAVRPKSEYLTEQLRQERFDG